MPPVRSYWGRADFIFLIPKYRELKAELERNHNCRRALTRGERVSLDWGVHPQHVLSR